MAFNEVGLDTVENQVKEITHINLDQELGETAHAESGKSGDIAEADGGDEDISLLEFATELYMESGESGNADDLNKSIDLLRRGRAQLAVDSKHHALALTNLGNALWSRFEQDGQESDLEEAFLLQGQALRLRPPPHSERSVSLNNLANVMMSRFQRWGQIDNLDEAILLNRQALELRPPPHADRPSSLNNLANGLTAKFKLQGQPGDLDDAILYLRQALEYFPTPHPSKSAYLNNLAIALWTRNGQVGPQNDLDEAIALHQEALQLRSPPHPLRPVSLHNLAAALWTRFKQGNQEADLDEALSLDRQALELLASPHPLRSFPLNNLGSGLLTRFEIRGHQCDLDDAITLLRESLELRPPPHPIRSSSLSNLAHAISTKFRLGQAGQQSDLAEVVSLYKEALELRPPGNPDRSFTFRNLGIVFLGAHSLLNDRSHLDMALSAFQEAVHCASHLPSQRFLSAKTWSHHADLHKHASALEAYDVTLRSLPELVALSSDVRSRHEALVVGGDELARKAAQCAIEAGNLEKAIEFLETGRAIFWAQALRLQSPLDKVREASPELGSRLGEIAAELELGSYQKIYEETLDNRGKMLLEHEARELQFLDNEWSKAIGEVRQLEGFEDFLLPYRLPTLMAAAADSPIVVLVSNDYTSDCLIMTSTVVHHIPIPSLTSDKLRKLVHVIQAAASRSNMRSPNDDTLENVDGFSPVIAETLRGWIDEEEKRGIRLAGRQFVGSDRVFKSVLRILWDEVVKSVVDFLGLQISEEPPVIQWCSTGLFTFLPIHAAGSYNDTNGNAECASDYFVSTYTPTIGVLLPSKGAPKPLLPTQKFKMMVVIDAKRLRFAKKELEKIKTRVPEESLVQFGILGAPALIADIASHISTASVVHFACHGKQDRHNPLDSGLVVEDGKLMISEVMQHPTPNGSVAFLSACETGTGDNVLPDEAMSVGASFLFSGFRHVVATMWEIRDADGPVVADAFYEELFRGAEGGKPDTGRSARALHEAVKKLRRNPQASFRHWVPFIHMGK